MKTPKYTLDNLDESTVEAISNFVSRVLHEQRIKKVVYNHYFMKRFSEDHVEMEPDGVNSVTLYFHPVSNNKE